MAKLLRIVIILLLILSVVALWLGLKLFSQREALKGRTQKLENGVVLLAKTVEANTPDELTAKATQMMDAQVSKDQLMAYSRMDEPLNLLRQRATLQLNRLNDTRETLLSKTQALAKVTVEKEKAEKDLTAQQALAKDLEQKATAAEEQAKQKTDAAAQLEEKNKALSDAADAQKAELTKLRDKTQDLELAKKQAEEKIKDLARRMAEMTENKSGVITVSPGLKGQVLIVNSNWNFIVMGVESNAVIGPAVELLVQRDDRFVGKIKISEVKPELNLAVAEILPEWRQGSIEEGDSVIY